MNSQPWDTLEGQERPLDELLESTNEYWIPDASEGNQVITYEENVPITHSHLSFQQQLETDTDYNDSFGHWDTAATGSYDSAIQPSSSSASVAQATDQRSLLASAPVSGAQASIPQFWTAAANRPVSLLPSLLPRRSPQTEIYVSIQFQPNNIQKRPKQLSEETMVKTLLHVPRRVANIQRK